MQGSGPAPAAPDEGGKQFPPLEALDKHYLSGKYLIAVGKTEWDNLKWDDPFMVCADFDAYVAKVG